MVRRRITEALIRVDGQVAGRCTITEYRPEPFTTRPEFLMQMDDHSAPSGELAEVLCGAWDEPTEVTDYGDIVEITRVWMRADLSGRGRLGSALIALIDKLNRRRSLLVLKAFPLDFEGTGEVSDHLPFQRRRTAMMRHYARLLGVRPFPGSSGENGWMYAIPPRLMGVIDGPDTIEAFD